MRRIRREAVSAGHDALIVHTDTVGWFHTSNAYLRYVCDWMREGVLIIPTDSDKELVLLSFFTQSVILPPGGEPVGVERDLAGRRDRARICRPSRLVDGQDRRGGCEHPEPTSTSRAGQIGRLGDRTSAEFFGLSRR